MHQQYNLTLIKLAAGLDGTTMRVPYLYFRRVSLAPARKLKY